MRVQRMVLPLSLALMGLSGCDVYEGWGQGEFNAGPVDAQNFPPDYLGAGANRLRAGTGSFTAVRAYAGEQPLGHFLLPLSPTQRAAANPLLVQNDGKGVSAAPAPKAYVFDAGCKAPQDYAFDPVRDDVHYGEQGTIFTALPTATYTAGAEPTWSYAPIISRVQVTSNDVECQGIKSEKTVLASREVEVPVYTDAATGKLISIPDSTYHAYAVIEPGAAVYRYTSTATTKEPATGLGIQKWGWYGQYLLAYLDGGEIPTTQSTTATGTVQVRMTAQKLYYPRSQVTVGTTNSTVTLGKGYDIVEGKRGEPGYSPVCQVFTYDAGGPLTPDQLPKSAAEVVARFGSTLRAPVKGVSDKSPVGDAYVYCLQAE
jgi:hypothetical protein